MFGVKITKMALKWYICVVLVCMWVIFVPFQSILLYYAFEQQRKRRRINRKLPALKQQVQCLSQKAWENLYKVGLLMKR